MKREKVYRFSAKGHDGANKVAAEKKRALFASPSQRTIGARAVAGTRASTTPLPDARKRLRPVRARAEPKNDRCFGTC